VFIVVGVVAAGAGLWITARKNLDIEGRLSEPREDEFQLRQNVPMLQSDLERARSELAAVQVKISEQRLEKATALAAHRTLLDSYPVLAQSGIGSIDSGPDWLSVRPEALHAFARARGELDAAARLAKSVEAELEKLTERTLDLAEKGQPPDTKAEVSRSRLAEGFRRANLAEQMSSARKALAETHAEIFRRQAQLETTMAADRRLASLSPSAMAVMNLPPEAIAILGSSRIRFKTAEALIASLDANTKKLREQESKLSTDLIKARRQAAHDYERGLETWNEDQRLKALRDAGPLALLLFIVIGVIYGVLYFRSTAWPNIVLFYSVALGTLAVLYAYNAFEATGGILAAVAVGVVALFALRGARTANGGNNA
jgi:hypothetical protein